MQDYGYACLLGGIRAMILMPIEHPLDYLKTQIQSRSYQGPTIEFVKNHVKSYGFFKLYTGFAPNTIRAAIKQAYRLPLMIAIPNFLRNFVNNENINQTCTGFLIAGIESYIMCPLERLKVWLMTAPVSTIMGFYRQLHYFKDLFKGVHALLLRQTLSWVTFLSCTSILKEATLSYKGSLEYYDLIIIGLLVGMINTAVIMPADFIKTHQQKYLDIQKSSMINLYKNLTISEFSLSGKLRIIYCGWKVRLANYIINSIFTVSLVDHIERQISTKYKN